MIRICPLSARLALLGLSLVGTAANASSRLYNQGAHRVLVDDGLSILYTAHGAGPDGSPRYASVVNGDVLSGARGRYLLRTADGSERRFVAGIEVSSRSLVPLPDAIERKRTLQASATPGLLDALVATERDETAECPERCDTSTHPASDAFLAGPSIDEAITQDVRPENCSSYFTEFVDIDRGTEIEAALAHADHYIGTVATVRSFPVVDFIGLGEARVVRSRDLASATYNVAGALHQRLMRDGRDIVEGLLEPLAEDGFIERTEQGQTTRIEAPAPTVVLEVVIQHGMASPAQIDEIRQAASDLASQWGIVLRIIEIP